MKSLSLLLLSAITFSVFGQKTVTSTLKLENVIFGSCSIASIPFKYSIKNLGPETFVFHASPSTPIDDLTFNVYLSQNETIETGILGGENDLRVGSAVPAQYTLNNGQLAVNKIAVPVRNPPYSSYRFMIVEVVYSSGPSMSGSTFISKKYRVSSGQVVFDNP